MSIYVVFKQVGLWDPIKERTEFKMQKATKINQKFQEFVHCLQELLDFEQFYYRFG